MISYLKGTLEESRPGKIVIDVNGLGFNVQVSDATREELPSIGNEVKIHTYMSVREDGMTLYGFLTRDALDLFNLLISVSGVGPKGAQAILGAYSVSLIKYYIVTEDVKNLSKAPTIGKKTAERIIVDLKDKVNKEDTLMLLEGEAQKTEASTVNMTPDAQDALEGLVALGYERKLAKEAILKIEHLEELNVNQILKLSLQYLF